jgi:hypothetical protein
MVNEKIVVMLNQAKKIYLLIFLAWLEKGNVIVN